jgi:fluoride exporter
VTPAVFLALVAAGALGAVARAWVGAAVRRRWRRRGLGTLFVNLSGAFALGLWAGVPGVSAAWLQVAGTGFLGAFTTFSTWMVEATAAWQGGRRGGVIAELAATLALGVAAAGLGFALGRGWG